MASWRSAVWRTSSGLRFASACLSCLSIDMLLSFYRGVLSRDSNGAVPLPHTTARSKTAPLLSRLRTPAPQRFEEWLAPALQLSFQTLGAVAIAAGPRFGSVLVLASPPVVRVLNTRQLEVLFPVGPFFEQRRGTVADFHPAGGLVFADPRLLHVP